MGGGGDSAGTPRRAFGPAPRAATRAPRRPVRGDGRRSGQPRAVARDRLRVGSAAPHRRLRGDRRATPCGADHLVELAAHHDAQELRILGRRVFEVIAPEVAEQFEGRVLEREEAEALRRTTLSMWEDDEGTCHGRFRIPTLHGQMLTEMILALASPSRTSIQRAAEGTVHLDRDSGIDPDLARPSHAPRDERPRRRLHHQGLPSRTRDVPRPPRPPLVTPRQDQRRHRTAPVPAPPPPGPRPDL